ncbi:Methionyl-tRNA_synthetase [Hexamita inflata]|uniref:Methionyl-tRNA synthetase n=1 Tax=Hexamita inflata TaxID=28002 RepID=A0AA86V6G3_9EUKA|nr:Methionyl-tRNA synthetase [Hexamita inflata]CAI9978266.1 Methionyl-tRNA synthetase [Hexamita inflata]
MSKLASAISSLEKLISHLESVTGQPAVPVQAQPKQQKTAPKKEAVELPALVQSFAKCELRVTQVKTCAPVPNSDKLLLMTLDIGKNQTRTFAAGVAQYYKPEELINKKIVTILNLKPRPMCEGTIVSEAMLFAGSYGEEANRVVKLCFPDQSVENGTRVTVENYELPEADGQPKKHFDKVAEELKALDNCMALNGQFLMAGGKKIAVDVPNGSHLG